MQISHTCFVSTLLPVTAGLRLLITVVYSHLGRSNSIAFPFAFFCLGKRCNFSSYNKGSLLLEQMKSFAGFTTMYKTADLPSAQENRVVDFRSDTISKPTDGMRKAMFEAEVGDDVMGEDPTVNHLEEKAAKMFGKEASLYVTSGTMGNLIATMAHCDRRGCEIIVGDKSHMMLWEQAGPAQLGGIQMTTIANRSDGTFCLEELRTKLRDGSNIHTTQTGLICVENTHNWCGGVALPLPWLAELAQLAKQHDIPLHLDGARVFNAALVSGLSVAELVKDFASISVCLSKGLGAPVGSLLIGDKQFINKSRRLRKVLGGGWRQAGVIAAGGLYALEHMVERLAVDHNRTRAIAEAITATGSKLIKIDMENVQSNILFINFPTPQLTAQEFSERLYKVSDEEAEYCGEDVCVIKVFTLSPTEVRVVLCCNITDEDVSAAIKKLLYVVKEFDARTV